MKKKKVTVANIIIQPKVFVDHNTMQNLRM